MGKTLGICGQLDVKTSYYSQISQNTLLYSHIILDICKAVKKHLHVTYVT